MNFRLALATAIAAAALSITGCGGEDGEACVIGGCPEGQVCDSDTGQCIEGCAFGTCPQGQICNINDNTCGPAEACDTTAPQPGACGYGAFCNASAVCQYVPYPTCPNFEGMPLTWTPTELTGPVIYSVETEVFAEDPTFCCEGLATCDASKRVRVNVQAYRPDGTFPETQEGLAQSLDYIQVDGTEGPVEGTLQDYVVGPDGIRAQWDQNFCVPSSFNQFTGGLQFEGGNPFCFVVQE